MAEVCGIRPWEWDLLNVEDAQQLMRYIDAKNEEAAK